MEIGKLVTLSIGSYYEFTLVIELDELPPVQTGEYVFYSEATKQLVDLSVISGNPATDTLLAPDFPDAPVIDVPVYTTDTVITGTGEPNSTVILSVGNEEYRGGVDAEGNYSVSIDSQEASTEIVALIETGSGYESEETSITVLEPPDTNPPDAPDVDPVHSDETVVNGTGEADATVVVTADGTEYEGVVDAEGNFSVEIAEPAADSVISVVLIDEAGNESEASEVTVIEAMISFYNVPDTITFETTELNPGNVRIPRTEPDWSLEVRDTRREGSPFKITAEAERPLTLTDGSHTLPDALVYVDENDVSHSLFGNPVEVYAGDTGGETNTSISWPAAQGPLIDVDPIDAQPGSYEAAIRWTIVDGP